MTLRMLVNATHAEETRVVVADEQRLVDFDFETSTKKQFKGNIYLARVVRVEPSLQAAFVDYGSNRHGFLSFNEIHPDYFRIPVADRRALLDQGKKEVEDESEEEETRASSDNIETLGGDETEDIARAGEAVRRRLRKNTRQYKIQEVIKRRQILLVQVVKEERGTKGAALTTYVSLAGRYCVLMPNTARGGGISRKITEPQRRKRLKTILSDLNVPEGVGVILRTAGAQRNKTEIRRDYEYLGRNWDNIRDLTLKSTAPTLIHEEANIIKRSLRDTYSREIIEVLVEGDEAYKAAKAFMKTMLPSHATRVQKYDGNGVPLFHHFQIEEQLDEIHSPIVRLHSGGSIVINPTEALVSIDVNSGRATGERNIEETALQTNKEAADEIARQLRLRDLAGLIVIDFIDMEDQRNNLVVERRLKEAMSNGRARVQIGRISLFGLLEMTRQRLRSSLVEAHTQPCPTCSGTGLVRSIESTTLRVLRAIEEEGIHQRTGQLQVSVPEHVAAYILNQKRSALTTIEAKYALNAIVSADDTLVTPDFRMKRLRNLSGEEIEVEEIIHSTRQADGERASDDGRIRRHQRHTRKGGVAQVAVVDKSASNNASTNPEIGASSTKVRKAATEEEAPTEPKRRRRGRRGGRRQGRRAQTAALPENVEIAPSPPPTGAATEIAQEVAKDPKRQHARSSKTSDADAQREVEATLSSANNKVNIEESKPPRRTRRPRTATTAAPPVEPASNPLPVANQGEAEKPKRRRRTRRPRTVAITSKAGTTAPIVRKAPASMEILSDAPIATNENNTDHLPRKGWWNRIVS